LTWRKPRISPLWAAVIMLILLPVPVTVRVWPVAATASGVPGAWAGNVTGEPSTLTGLPGVMPKPANACAE